MGGIFWRRVERPTVNPFERHAERTRAGWRDARLGWANHFVRFCGRSVEGVSWAISSARRPQAYGPRRRQALRLGRPYSAEFPMSTRVRCDPETPDTHQARLAGVHREHRAQCIARAQQASARPSIPERSVAIVSANRPFETAASYGLGLTPSGHAVQTALRDGFTITTVFTPLTWPRTRMFFPLVGITPPR
jgi:hypothetical protein